MLSLLIAFMNLWVLCLMQGCLDANGVPVSWWAILKVPPKIGKSGFGYFDSNSQGYEFKYTGSHVDEKSALTSTLLQINTVPLYSVAWNDEKPTGQTSSYLAHSKGLIAYYQLTKKGFFISHSIPKYPAFTNNNQVNITIGSSQNYYGQDIFCISLSLSQLNKLAFRLLIIRPFIYQKNARNITETNYIADLASGKQQRVSVKFQMEEFNPSGSVNLKTIFKNGFENCSIFEDGLTNYLKTNLIAETWGRPLEAKWCSQPYSVNNVQKVSVGGLLWGQADDHSKWVSAGSQYACFGDMNRMTSQWKRGGSFYCLNHVPLAAALSRTIIQSDKC